MLVNQFFLFANAKKAAEDRGEGPSVVLKIPAEQYNIPVERLELSSRTLNCLKRAGINKVGEVLEMSKAELLRIRNFGEKSYSELFGRLRDMDLLPPDIDPEIVQAEEETTEQDEPGTETSQERETPAEADTEAVAETEVEAGTSEEQTG